MSLFCTAIYDKKTHQYTSVSFVPDTMVSIRNFEIAVKNPDTTLNHFRDDFSLVKISCFDDKTGSFFDNEIEVLKEASDV